jgi:hypothetical protein
LKYPSKLLPKIFYGLLNMEKLSQRDGHWLLRNCERTLLSTDIDTAISSQSKYLRNLSVSIGGAFERKHSKLLVLKADEGEFDYHQKWSRWQRPKNIPSTRFQHNDEMDCILFQLKDINNYPFNDSFEQTNYNYRCKVEHVPTFANYWHCEILWYDEEGNKLEPNKRGRLFPVEVLSRFKNLYRTKSHLPSKINFNQIKSPSFLDKLALRELFQAP